MNFITNRFYVLLAGIILLLIGLFFTNPFVGFAICLLIAVAAFYDEKTAIYFLIITIPIRPFLIIYNSGYKFIGDLLIILLLLKIAYNHRKNIRDLFHFSLLEITFFSFIFVGILSAFFTGVSIPAIIMQTRAFLLFFLLFYITKRMQIEKKDIFDFALITFITAVTLSIHGLIEKISSRKLLLPEVWKNMDLAITNKIRVYGLIGGPNELALYLAISFIISFYLLQHAARKFRTFIYIGMILILTVFFLTYSRGAVLGIIAFLIVYFFINRKLVRLKPLVIMLLSSAVLFFAVVNITDYASDYFTPKNTTEKTTNKENKPNPKQKPNQNQNKEENGLNRFSGAFSDDELAKSNVDGRVYYVKKAVEVFKDRPIIGYGFGTFGGAATQTYSSPIYKHYDISWDFYSDNQYIQILAETGLVGTLLILIFVVSAGLITWKLRKGYPFSTMLIFFLVAALASGVVYNILENDVFTLYYFIILGFGYRYLDNKHNKSLIQ
jgi:putative inorganic carbon (hco3(-)) transporter